MKKLLLSLAPIQMRCKLIGLLLFVPQFTYAQFSADPDYSRQLVLAPLALERFYIDSRENLVWNNESDFADLLIALQGLEVHGLNPHHYHLQLLQQNSADMNARDRLATDAWFSAAAHMLYGKLDPVSVEPDWTAARREADLAAKLQEALNTGSVATSLEQFAPKQKGYKVLVEEYSELKNAAAIPIVTVTSGPALRAGMRNERVTALQTRLEQLQFLTSAQISGTMDADTVEAVKLFQYSMDLDDDGIVGAATITALNRDLQAKLEQIRVNLERWRWLPDDLGKRHLRANIAGFNVTAWNDGVIERSHLTIVGKNYRKTPVFSDQIEYIIFNPWWEVPTNIARIDKLPLFQKEPEIVSELGYQVLDRGGNQVDPDSINWHEVKSGSFPYRLRQAPGEQNALGQVKIMFPNSHNVYLHDTPTRGLFAQRQRAFSSGCLRTQDPLDLAAWLLEAQTDWNREKIEEVVQTGSETRVNLAQRIPVHVLYFTAVSEERGGVRYLDDIYQRDAAVLAGLRTTPH